MTHKKSFLSLLGEKKKKLPNLSTNKKMSVSGNHYIGMDGTEQALWPVVWKDFTEEGTIQALWTGKDLMILMGRRCKWGQVISKGIGDMQRGWRGMCSRNKPAT